MLHFVFRSVAKRPIYNNYLIVSPRGYYFTKNINSNYINNNSRHNCNMANNNKIGIVITEDGPHWGGEAGIGCYFTKRFKHVSDSFDYHIFHGVSGVLPQPEQFSGYIGFVISGSRHSVNDNCEWIENCRIFIRQLADHNKMNTTSEPVRLFGICYGHQLIATAFGGLVKSIIPYSDGPTFIFGAEKVEFTQQLTEKTWFTDIFKGDREAMVVQSHGEEVSVIPDNAVNVGRSTTCQNEVLMYGDNIISFQGHPELEVETLERIIGTRLLKAERVTREYHEQGMNNARKVPSDSLTKFVLSFLNH